MDDAMCRVETLVAGTTLSLAVLNRPDGTTVLAVTLDGNPFQGLAHHRFLAAELAVIFDGISVVESPFEALATASELT